MSFLPVASRSGFKQTLFRAARQPHALHRFSTNARRQAHQHHSYFRADSPIVYFPEDSRFGPRQSKSHHSEPASSSRSSRSNDGNNNNNFVNLSVFITGFVAYPLLQYFLNAGDWAFGTVASPQASEDIRVRASHAEHLKQSHVIQQMLARANAETIMLHEMLRGFIRSDEGLRALSDPGTLRRHPIKMSDGTTLGQDKARLVRILNREGKTLVLLLAVDMSGHPPSEKEPALAWTHDYALRDWMHARATELDRAGDTADPGNGLLLFCYTATSSATGIPSLEANRTDWQECHMPSAVTPAGFPLSAFDGIKSIEDDH